MRKQRSARWTDHFEVVVPSRRRDLVEHPMDGEVILYDPRSGQVHGLNETALSVWRQCDGLRTARRIAEEQTASYSVELPQALDHVEQLLVCFAQSDLLEDDTGDDCRG